MRQMASFIGCSDNYLYIIWRLFCKVCQYRRTIPNVQHVPKCKVDKIISKKWIDKWWFLLLISLIIFRAGLIIGGHYTGHLGILPYLNSYVNPLTTLMSACIFIGCSKLSFNSTTINWLSASSLAVYLCSESPFGQMFFDSWFPHIEWNFLHFIIGAIAVYFCITIIDQIRKSITHNLIVNKLK